MNSDTNEELVQIAKAAGARVPCGTCGSYDVHAFSDDANKAAFAMATKAWQGGLFGGADHREIMDAMQGVIDDANHSCPSCG